MDVINFYRARSADAVKVGLRAVRAGAGIEALGKTKAVRGSPFGIDHALHAAAGFVQLQIRLEQLASIGQRRQKEASKQ